MQNRIFRQIQMKEVKNLLHQLHTEHTYLSFVISCCRTRPSRTRWQSGCAPLLHHLIYKFSLRLYIACTSKTHASRLRFPQLFVVLPHNLFHKLWKFFSKLSESEENSTKMCKRFESVCRSKHPQAHIRNFKRKNYLSTKKVVQRKRKRASREQKTANFKL